MEDLIFYLARFLGKTTSFILRRLPHQGGTALPGLIALKIEPRFIKKQVGDFKNIVISGTNGKTTTTRMVATIFKREKVNFIHNRHGSNLLRGIASAIISNPKDNFKEDSVALWEVDEGALPEVIKETKPQVVLLLNLFRDQLDRYGEIEQTAIKWAKSLKKLPEKSLIILNADDPYLVSIGKKIPHKKIYIGLKSKGSKEFSSARDINLCPICSKKLLYKYFYMAHIGKFRCSKCSFKNEKLDYYINNIVKRKNKKTAFTLNTAKKKYTITSIIPGFYNIYNTLAAFSLANSLKISGENIVSALKDFKPAFGRVETLQIKKRPLKIFLVKNPTGFNQILLTLKEEAYLNVLIAINDLIADGRDISWLWDVDFALLKKKARKIIVSGRRAEDMALRLKYEDFTNIRIETDLSRAINSLVKQKRNLFILPTYTAMLEIRKILTKKKIIHSSWED